MQRQEFRLLSWHGAEDSIKGEFENETIPARLRGGTMKPVSDSETQALVEVRPRIFPRNVVGATKYHPN